MSKKDRVLTIPNAISSLRILLIIPYCAFIIQSKFIYAFIILIFASASDYLDGLLARKLNQNSYIGEILDPVADRLLIFSSCLLLCIKGIMPLWLVILVFLREFVVGVRLLQLKKAKNKLLKVNFAGKAGSLLIMYSAPAFLLSTISGVVGYFFTVMALALSIWGIFMYWIAGGIYLNQINFLIPRKRK